MRKNDWASRFGAARRAIDRKLLAECEKQIALEERDNVGVLLKPKLVTAPPPAPKPPPIVKRPPVPDSGRPTERSLTSLIASFGA